MSRRPAPAVTVVLDNEAVQALADPAHHKHRSMIARLRAVAVLHDRRTRAEVVTPTAVRVEAGAARSDPSASALGRFQVTDLALDSRRAERCIELSQAAGGSVVDATVAQAAEEHAEAGRLVTVLTADLTDLDRLIAQTASSSAIRVRRV